MVTIQKVNNISEVWRELEKIARALNELEKQITDLAATVKTLTH